MFMLTLATIMLGGSITPTVKAEEKANNAVVAQEDVAQELVEFLASKPELVDEEGYLKVIKPIVGEVTQEQARLAEEVVKHKNQKAKEFADNLRITAERKEQERIAREQAEAEEAERARLLEVANAEQAKDNDELRQIEAEQASNNAQERLESASSAGLPSEVTSPQQNNTSSGAISAEFTAYYPVGADASSAEIAMQGRGVTASGHDLKQSIYQNGYKVIAAPPAYAFGTLLRITAGGQSFVGIVSDRGGAIQGNKFDIAVANQGEALGFGRQQGTVEILN